MSNLKEKLLQTNVVIDNEFLDLYVEIIESNYLTKKEKFKTHRHHIIPKYYFKYLHIKVDNSKNNLVNLNYSDHILAHFYLMMCSSEQKYKINNRYAIERLGISTQLDIDKIEIVEYRKEIQEEYEKLRPLNAMDIPEYKIKHDNRMREESVRTAISNTMKNKFSNNKKRSYVKKSYQTQSVVDRRVRINKDGQYKNVSVKELEEYLNNGWKRGGRPLSESHKQALLNSLIGRKISDESRQKMRESHLGHTPVNKGIPHKEETKLKIRESISGRKWINNGEIEKQVKAEEVNNYLKQGFELGRLHINKIKR